MKNNPQIFQEWVEALAAIDVDLAFENYHRHRLTNNWFPDIADIARPVPVDASLSHRLLQAETEILFLELDSWAASNKPPEEGYWESVRAIIAGEAPPDE